MARLVFAGQHHGFAYTGALHQLSFNFAELDTEAAQFDLKVITAEIVDVAVGSPAAEVTGLVHAGIRIGGERIGKEAFGGQFGAVQVATGNTGTRDMDFASHTERNGLTVGVENIDPGIGYRLADGRCSFFPAITQINGCADRTFSRSIGIDHTPTFSPAFDQRG